MRLLLRDFCMRHIRLRKMRRLREEIGQYHVIK